MELDRNNLAELFANKSIEFKPLLEKHIEYNDEFYHMSSSDNVTSIYLQSKGNVLFIVF